MGLRETVQKAATTAFKAIGNIPLICTYTSVDLTPVYDPAAGTYTTDDTDYTGLKILFEDYTVKEIVEAGGAILSTDIKASIPNLSLTPSPKKTDKITDSNSVVWTVEGIPKIDAATALWIMQCRRTT